LRGGELLTRGGELDFGGVVPRGGELEILGGLLERAPGSFVVAAPGGGEEADAAFGGWLDLRGGTGGWLEVFGGRLDRAAAGGRLDLPFALD